MIKLIITAYGADVLDAQISEETLAADLAERIYVDDLVRSVVVLVDDVEIERIGFFPREVSS